MFVEARTTYCECPHKHIQQHRIYNQPRLAHLLFLFAELDGMYAFRLLSVALHTSRQVALVTAMNILYQLYVCSLD